MTTTRAPAANRFQPIDPQPHDTPQMPNQTDKTLAQIRTELLTTFSAADWESYNRLVGWLRDTDVASHALKVGDDAPDFLLPDADGRLHSSEQLRRNGPLVLSFFRGGWCPFCTAELCSLQAAKDEFETVGATLVVVTPETRELPAAAQAEPGLGPEGALRRRLRRCHVVWRAIPDARRDQSALFRAGLRPRRPARSPVEMLPIPATYVIDARRPDPQRVRRARLHDTGGAGANPGLVAPGRFHVVVRKAEGGKRHQGQSDNELV